VGVELDEFARATLPGLLSFARALTADRALAEDVVYDVLTKLYAQPDRWTDVRNGEAYARRMIVNEYLSWGRKWFRIQPHAQLPELAGADVAVAVADREMLRGELARLPRRRNPFPGCGQAAEQPPPLDAGTGRLRSRGSGGRHRPCADQGRDEHAAESAGRRRRSGRLANRLLPRLGHCPASTARVAQLPIPALVQVL
jgi:hypothetical protein